MPTGRDREKEAGAFKGQDQAWFLFKSSKYLLGMYY